MAKFHIIALKCGECGSYNTSRDDDAPLNAAVAAVLRPQNVEVQVEQEDTQDNEDNEGEIGNDEDSEDMSEDITDNSGDDNASVQSDLSLD